MCLSSAGLGAMSEATHSVIVFVIMCIWRMAGNMHSLAKYTNIHQYNLYYFNHDWKDVTHIKDKYLVRL